MKKTWLLKYFRSLEKSVVETVTADSFRVEAGHYLFTNDTTPPVLVAAFPSGEYSVVESTAQKNS